MFAKGVMMSRKDLSEKDICTKFIYPDIKFPYKVKKEKTSFCRELLRTLPKPLVSTYKPLEFIRER